MPTVYGIHPVKAALAGGQVERLVLQQDSPNPRLRELAGLARAGGVDVRFEPRARLDRLADGGVHQGAVALLAGQALRSLEDLLDAAPPNPVFLVLDGVEDPHNLGAILRSADGAGVSGVILPKRRTAPLSDVVWKASAGAAAHVPLARVANVAQTLEELKQRGIWVAGADMAGDREWHQLDWTGPVALVLGGEGAGLHDLVRRRCDFLVRLPLLGTVQSLNVSVTAGILLYEIIRQRHPEAKTIHHKDTKGTKQ